MADILKIIKRRSTPGILIYGTDHRLLYANEEALELIPELRKPAIKKASKVREEIDKICAAVRHFSEQQEANNCDYNSAVLPNDVGPPYYMRAFPLMGAVRSKELSQILILIEKVILKREIIFDDVQTDFGLTNRELEVLKLLSLGLTNKELSDKLSVCEYTVKDHIKKLMQKIGVSSRTAIITHLK